MARKPILSKKQLDEILDNHPYNMCDKQVLVSKYNISTKTAERTMKKLGLIQTSSRNIECILRYLKGERNRDLIKEYKMSQANFNGLLRYRNIKPRHTQYFFNHHYFEEIDSEDKAYFLGFIYADGCLHKNSLSISIRDYDIDVIENFKACTQSNHKIRKFNVSGYSSKTPVIERYMVEIILTHKELPEILKKHGIVQNKTHKLECIPKTVPNDLVRHFMRGYIDGDGSFGRYTHNDGYDRNSLSIIGTDIFLIDFSKKAFELSGYLFLKTLTNRYPERKTNTRALKMSGSENVLNFLNWIYKDANFYMERKYKKYKDMVE